jgi:hypothetical protein
MKLYDFVAQGRVLWDHDTVLLAKKSLIVRLL